MKYTKTKLGMKRKEELEKIIEQMKASGVKINWNDYPEYHSKKVLVGVILDYQDLVPGELPDLTKMTEVIDEFNDAEVTIQDEEIEEEIEEPEIEDVPQSKWDKVKELMVKAAEHGGSSSDKGREFLVRAIYVELLDRDPINGDVKGLAVYKAHIRDGLSINNIRDAIKKSLEYRKGHGLL